MTDEDDKERRRGERVPVNAEFARLASEATYVSDLSEHGVFVHTQQVLPVGSKIELRFTVLLADPVVIQALGRVVRGSQDPPGLGIEFGPLSPETVRRINEAVSHTRPRDAGQPLQPDQEEMPASDVAARSLTEEEFEGLATRSYPAAGRPSEVTAGGDAVGQGAASRVEADERVEAEPRGTEDPDYARGGGEGGREAEDDQSGRSAGRTGGDERS